MWMLSRLNVTRGYDDWYRRPECRECISQLKAIHPSRHFDVCEQKVRWRLLGLQVSPSLIGSPESSYDKSFFGK